MHRESNRCGALAALAMAAALCGCGSSLAPDSNERWFAKPIDLFGNRGGYTYSELQESRTFHAITENDLVDANGGCSQVAAAVAPGPDAAPPPELASQLGGSIALGMSECDVVRRAGAPASVQLGNNPNGDRTAVITFNNGPRAGIYRFERGRLAQMDRGEQPPPPQTEKKKPAKPKTANSDG